MKTRLWLVLGMTLLFFLSSCNDEKFISNNQLVRSISVTGQDFVDGDGVVGTRASYSVDGTGFHFTWTQGDTVGIYPVGGDQVAFPISSGEGSQIAQFDGGAWALRSSYSYAAYYPFSSGNYHIDETSLPVNYVGQSQNGNGSLDGMDRFDYQASVATNPDGDGNVNISLKHLGCFVRFQLTMPIADTYKSVTLQSNKAPFVTSGTYDLTKETMAITPIVTSSSITIELKNTSTTTKNKVLTIYAMMAPADLSSSEITITVKGTTSRLYTATVKGKNMLAGKSYSYVSACCDNNALSQTETITGDSIYQYIGYANNYEQVLDNAYFRCGTVKGTWSSNNTPEIDAPAPYYFFIITTEQINSVTELGGLLSYVLTPNETNSIYDTTVVSSKTNQTYKIYKIGPLRKTGSTITIDVDENTQDTSQTETTTGGSIYQYLGYANNYEQVLDNAYFSCGTVNGTWSSSNTPIIEASAPYYFYIITTEEISSVTTLGGMVTIKLEDIYDTTVVSLKTDQTYRIYKIGPLQGTNSTITID